MKKLVVIVPLMLLLGCQYHNDADPKTVSDLDMTGCVVVPERDAAPDRTLIAAAQYTGTIDWRTEDGAVFEGAVFAVSSIYTATVTLSAKDGWTFDGVKENSFTHNGAAEIRNEKQSGTVIIVFPATASLTEQEIALAEAASFKDAHARALALDEGGVAIEDETAIDAALTAYTGLSAAARYLLEAERTLLDGLKAKIERLKPVAKLSLAVGSFVTDGIVIENEKKIYLVAPSGTPIASLRLQLTYQDAAAPATGAPHDFSSPVSYTIAKQSGETEVYMVEVIESALPVMMIKTPGAISVDTKEEWLEDASFVLYDGNGNLTQGSTEIKLRGNATATLPKKPYAIKLSRPASLLGMPYHQRWNLLANFVDPTMLRNETAFKMGSILDAMAWTPRSDQTVLYVNGEYLGVYQLTEAIKINANRVNVSPTISKSNPNGGYILEIDKFYKGEPFHIETAIKHIWFSCSDPDEDVDEIINGDSQTVLEKMAADVQMAEDALYSDDFMDPETGYRKYLDVDSFVDWWLANEIVKNYEIRLLNGQYMYYDPGKKKYCMGPLWDYDISFGWASSYGSEITSGFMVDKDTTDNAAYWRDVYEWWHVRLLQDPYFVTKVKERWNEIQPGLLSSLLTYIDERSSYIQEAQALDIKKWGRDINQSDSVAFLKTWLTERITWLDPAIRALQ